MEMDQVSERDKRNYGSSPATAAVRQTRDEYHAAEKRWRQEEEEEQHRVVHAVKARNHEEWRRRVLFRPAADKEQTEGKGNMITRAVRQSFGYDTAPKIEPAPAEVRPVDEVLAERRETHGDFSENARVAQTIRYTIREASGWTYMNMEQREALDHIAGKIARAVAGDGLCIDHWTDIGGYARLGELATVRRLKS